MEGREERNGDAGRGRPLSQGRSHLSCSRTCFLAGVLAGGGWVMAAPKDKVSGCALERPPQAWTMLGWGARPRGGSFSHEVCLQDRVLRCCSLACLIGQKEAPTLDQLCAVFTGASSVSQEVASFSLREGQDLFGGTQGTRQSGVRVTAR